MESIVKDKKLSRVSVLGQCSAPRAIPQEGQLVKFVYAAIQANRISVVGTFNNWTVGAFTLKKDSVGVWRGALHLKPGTYQYRYNVDGKWVNDPSARNTVLNEFGTRNTVLEVR